MEVHRQLGPGFLEAIYQEAMEIELSLRNIPFRAQQEMIIRYKGRLLNKFYVADFICLEKIVVELKALDRLSGKEQAQILNYLKASDMRVGVLVNFGSQGRLEWQRFVN